MSTYIVLGSTSFAGAWFVHEALTRGHQVIGMSRSPEPEDIFLPYKSNKNLSAFTYKQLDVNKDTDAIIEVIKQSKANYVIDFAGQGMVAPSWDWPEQWYTTNVASKAKIQNALRHMDFLDRYVRISTPEVYGHTEGLIKEDATYNPTTPYAISHTAIDMNAMAYHKQFDLPVTLARFANFYGSSQQLYRITPRAIFCAITGETLPLHGGGKSIRAFIHAKDVANGIFLSIERGHAGEVYHFSTDEFVTIRELVEKIASSANVTLESFAQVTEDRPAKDAAYFMSSDKAKENLGWKAEYTLDSGIQDTYVWVRENLDIIKTLSKNYTHKE